HFDATVEVFGCGADCRTKGSRIRNREAQLPKSDDFAAPRVLKAGIVVVVDSDREHMQLRFDGSGWTSPGRFNLGRNRCEQIASVIGDLFDDVFAGVEREGLLALDRWCRSRGGIGHPHRDTVYPPFDAANAAALVLRDRRLRSDDLLTRFNFR